MKILHTADIHIGYESHGRIDPETGLNSRLLDFKYCFQFMVEKALEEDIDAFLFCGDAYYNTNPTTTQQKIFAECLRPISDAGIPIIMITGNHDQPISFGKATSIAIFQYLDGNVHLYEQPKIDTIQTKSGALQLIALPWPIRSKMLSKEDHRLKTPAEIRVFIEEMYIKFVNAAEKQLKPELPTILAAHLTVHGAEMGGSERTSTIQHDPTFTVGDLARPYIDYVALGHIHRFQDRNEGHHPPVVYSSSIERISYKEKDDQKGFVIVEINPNESGKQETHYRFIETPARQFIGFDVDLCGKEDPMAFLLAHLAKKDVANAFVRVRYEIDEDQTALMDANAIREALKDAFSVTSIERQIEKRIIQKVSYVTQETSLESALEQYIAENEHLKSIQEDMLQRAAELQSQLEMAE